MKRLAAEAIGTFALVFCGTGAIVIDTVTHGGVSHAGVAITFGLIVMAMIYAVGDVSGAHLNPAVTLGFVLARRFEARRIPGYLAAQLIGALAASGLLRLLFLDSPTLGETLPLGPVWQSFILEAVLTFFLMLVILRVSTGPKEKGITAAIAVGGVVALEAMFAGPICGASMNPARSLAPAVVGLRPEALWLYLIAPPLGAALAVACARELGDKSHG
jgi:aquaporin Z